MKTIVKRPPSRFRETCTRCTGVFTYQLDDVDYLGYVSCPSCGYRCVHLPRT